MVCTARMNAEEIYEIIGGMSMGGSGGTGRPGDGGIRRLETGD